MGKIMTIEELKKLNPKPKRDFVYFWGGRNDNFYLSNWYMSDFVVDKIKYNCMEQYFMAQKAVLFKDEKRRKEIMLEKTPKGQKAIGRRVKDFRNETWNENKEKIMIEGLLAKFSQNEDLWLDLRETRGKYLAEASPYDRIWGIGLDRHRAESSNVGDWQGENLLGFLLMYVRQKICEI